MLHRRTWHLIVALLGLWLYFPLALTNSRSLGPAPLAAGEPVKQSASNDATKAQGTSREDRNAFIIRPAITNFQESLPTGKVTVNRRQVPLGEEVTFTLEPASVVLSPAFTIILYFGDGTQQQIRQTRIVQLYRKVGIYEYSISVKRSGQAPFVTLSATPTSTMVGSQVAFKAHIAYAYPNLRYRFVFGDNSQTDWQVSPQTSHS